MKVKVSCTLEIDEDRWAEMYSLESSEVREDVKRYAEYVLRETLEQVKS